MSGAGALSHAEVLGRYVGAFVDELAAHGLADVCLCPGSRSTPLAVAFARHPGIKVWTHLDERSCAYFGLGMAKAEGQRPVAVLCSSGTAALNFAPAVTEAYYGQVPLLVLTADRPQELRDLGANQTIDQVRLYGSSVRWFVEMPLPEASEEMLRYVRLVAARALATTNASPNGPVHLNFPFREPLIPALPAAAAGFGRYPTTEKVEAVAPAVPYSLVGSIGAWKRGLIVCGPDRSLDAGAVAELTGRRWPVLADPLSGLRCGPQVGPNIVGSYNTFLRSPALVERLKPDFIMRFGAPPTSKPLETCLAAWHDVPQVVVAPPGQWPDPYATASSVLHCDLAALGKVLGRVRMNRDWLAAWQDAESRTRAAIESAIAALSEPTEVSAITDLASVLPEAATVFVGNSMPVRDLDSFWPQSDRPTFFEANRGASGIDGVVSTALGSAAVRDGRVILVIGDLSFYHDMNGLLAAKRFGLSATIVLINNHGGGIFSFLPQHEQAEDFEALFGTPHGLDFAPIADLYGVGYQRVTTREEYRAALLASFEAPGVQVIEVRTDREENLRLHQEIWQAVEAALAPSGAK
jgi:2-succinyl-5-enolpyruvyl-6-hydroxy-3-cyclohexene-1-carboxylate synthase